MTFPVLFHVGSVTIQAHTVFETLGYTVGFQLYRHSRRQDRLPGVTSLVILAASIIGGFLGSKLLFLTENPALTAAHAQDWSYIFGGKTIVGGMLGGLIAVEYVKRAIGHTRSTGDDIAIPLAIGLAIGRIGCFLAGTQDGTAGGPTTWPTGVDFGDGIPRHPTQLYEIAFLLLMIPVLLRLRRFVIGASEDFDGVVFQAFMLAYLSFRLMIDSVKSDIPLLLGLTGIQLACIAGLLYYSRSIPVVRRALLAH